MSEEKSYIERIPSSLRFLPTSVLGALLASCAMTQSAVASCGDYLHTSNSTPRNPAAIGQEYDVPDDLLTQDETLPSRPRPCHGPECGRHPMPFAPVLPSRISTDHNEQCCLAVLAFQMRDDLDSAFGLEDALRPSDAPRSRIDYPPEA